MFENNYVFIISCLGVSCLILLWLLVYTMRHYRRDTAKVREVIANCNVFVSELQHANEQLKVYLDNQHVVWNPNDEDFFIRKPEHAGMVVVANRDELRLYFQSIWDRGYAVAEGDYSKRIQMLLNQQPEGNISQNDVTTRASIGDKKFDHDFAIFVNRLTRIASDYGQTQQLRGQISHVVTDYRSYLTKKQEGQDAHFPS